MNEETKSGWRKRQVNEVYEKIRNDTLEEVAKEIEKMTVFGKDTVDSFAVYIREMKR
jgi:predicted transcriptional regulator